jgi:8-oxo-dGTP pyrophosphatase MutT (NUDIX family)
MSFLDHIRRANNWNRAEFRPFTVDHHIVGYIRPDRIEHLRAFPDIFVITPGDVALAPALDSFKTRSAAMEQVLRALREAGEFPGWRNEYYPVMPEWDDQPLMRVERATCPWLGVRSWGVHINGFVRRADGLHMWVARRARDKPTYPGMLDNMVAGGQPIGIGLLENVIKECAEEAGIPADIAATACAVGTISYWHALEDGVKPDQQFCYDLELPADFTPHNTDGEVDGFELWPIERVAETVRETFEFKYNCNLVNIDFLIRHGLIDADTEPDYVALCLGLRPASCPDIP